jgi:hypothetical protein
MKIFNRWNNTSAEIDRPPVPKKDFLREAKPENKLPPLANQNGPNNFARFSQIHGRRNSFSSQTSNLSSSTNSRPNSTASGVHGQQSNFEKMVHASIARIDSCTGIDWDGFASQNPGLEKHVRAIQKISTKLNAMVIENMTKQIQPLPEHIAQAEERSRPGIEQEAEKQIPTKFKEKWFRKNREKRTTKRDDVIKTKLNEVREGVISEQKNSIIRLEQNHPKSLEDECQMYFRSDEFNSGVPEALMELQQQLVEHAKNVVAGKLSASPAHSLYAPSIATTDSFQSKPTFRRGPSIVASSTPVLSTFNDNVVPAHDWRQSQNSLNLSETSQLSSSQTEYYSTYGGSNSSNSTRAPSFISVENESENGAVSGSHAPNQKEITGESKYRIDDKVDPDLSKPLPVSPEERAIDFLGGDKLDPRIKDFLQNRKLPDARLNHKGEAEWIKKEEE